MKPKKTTKFLGKDSSELGEGLILPGTMGAMKTFNTFIVSLPTSYVFDPHTDGFAEDKRFRTRWQTSDQ